MQFNLDADAFGQAFPFHFAFDAGGVVLQVGDSLRRLCPAFEPGARLDELVAVRSPRVQLVGAEWRRHMGACFMIELRATRRVEPVLLRGQITEAAEGAGYLFLGSPWLYNAASLTELGLAVRDFAAHDATLDHLFVRQAQNMAVADAQRMLSELETAERERNRLEQVERSLEHELNASGDFLIRVDREGTVIDLRCSDLAGVFPEPSEVLGRPVGEVLSELGELLSRELEHVFAEPTPRAFEFTVKREGPLQHFDCRVASTLAGDAIIVGRDISDRRRLEEQLRHQALHDALTQLPNRTLLERRLGRTAHRLSASSDSRCAALLFIDLDDFKTVNDALGHATGDQLLASVARRLEASLRSADMAARIGGDEFAVLLDDLGHPGDALEVAQRIHTKLVAPLLLDDVDLEPSCSIGVTVIDGTEEPGVLLRRADLAMYRAKDERRGSVELFDEELQRGATERLELKRDLPRAIENKEFYLLYQPVVDMVSLELVGVEALVRWQHPQHGLIPPDRFIGLAEESGAIIELGSLVLREACSQLARWRAAAPTSSFGLAVNLSAKQLRSAELLDRVDEALRDSGIAPGSLTLEVTETHAMHDLGETVSILNALRAKGLRVALDDFGTGYSSLSYLGNLPIDVLKIDKVFVDRLGEHDRAPLAEAVVELGHRIGLQVVAEGIEEPDQVAMLRALGCDRGQGYFFSRPVPAEDLERWLEDSTAGRPCFAETGGMGATHS